MVNIASSETESATALPASPTTSRASIARAGNDPGTGLMGFVTLTPASAILAPSGRSV